jgi:hypothetical protein
MNRSNLLGAGWVFLLFLGCGPSVPPPPARGDTGAEAKAREFFEALLREDWTKAYEQLGPQSKASVSQETFTRLARQHRSHIGFTPLEVHVSASETGDFASAVANFKGLVGTTMRSSRDGTGLKQTDSGWVVVLRENFGRLAKK